MLAVFTITFPFFALVVCGYVAVRRAILPQLAVPGLNSFVLYRFGSTTPPTRLLDPGVPGVYLSCALCMVGLALAISRRRGLDWNNAAFGALVAAFPNTGFMGVPLLLALLGPASSGLSPPRFSCWRTHDNKCAGFVTGAVVPGVVTTASC
jgi:malonate transporter